MNQLSTQTAYILSISVVQCNRGEYALSTIPIARITGLIFTVYTFLQWATHCRVIIQGLPQGALNLCEGFYLLVEACRKPLQKTLAFNYQGGVL